MEGMNDFEKEETRDFKGNRKSRNINAWLESSQFIKEVDYKNKYYLESLCHHIAAFLKNVPVPIISSFDSKHKSIYLIIGKDKKFFPLDEDISYYDMITCMKQWAMDYYPKYEVSVLKEIPLTDEEIMALVKNGMDLNDALVQKKEESLKEIGIIEKVFIKEDKFILSRNGEKELRISGVSLKQPMPLSKFMESVRRIRDWNEKKKFIEENSTFEKFLPSVKEVYVNYSDNQMLNFFSINYKDLRDHQVIVDPSDPLSFKIGKFRIKFDSRLLRDDCLAYLEKRKMVEKKKA
ncbi:MAG: hypothetical protein BWY64_03502 [bacterium ADurb.Bin363]|nr:MAG: hypothetical protein BWY64_03502 [bacterium ADurb.Bin363]